VSELLGDIDVEFPKTVTGCHVEIRRLETLLTEADKQLEAKEETIDDLQGKVDEFEEEAEELEDDATNAIHKFLDECERTGPLRFDVPQTDQANRAIVALHDAVGRRP
jgi:chromosome segregation ATPase